MGMPPATAASYFREQLFFFSRILISFQNFDTNALLAVTTFFFFFRASKTIVLETPLSPPINSTSTS